MAAKPSFPDFHVTGAVHHFCRFPGDASIWYLGTAEVTPKVHFDIKWRDHFNDIAGKELPAQRSKQGKMAVVGILMNRYSKPTYDQILVQGTQIDVGHEARLSRGSLAFGLHTFEMWQVFDNYSDPNFRSVGMEPGYYWPQVMLGDEDRDTLGTEVEKLLLVLEAYPVQQSDRSWKLYSKSIADFPADVLVPQ